MTQNQGDTETAAREALIREIQERAASDEGYEVTGGWLVDNADRLLAALRPASPGEVTVTEAMIRAFGNAFYGGREYGAVLGYTPKQLEEIDRDIRRGLTAALSARPTVPDAVAVTEAIQKHPDYERVRKVWDDALKISEGYCRDLDEKLEQETERVVEYSNRISALLSEKADLTAALSARPTTPDAVAAEEEKK